MVSEVVEASFAYGVDDQSQFVVPLFPKFAHLKIESIIWNVLSSCTNHSGKNIYLPVSPNITSDLGSWEVLAQNWLHQCLFLFLRQSFLPFVQLAKFDVQIRTLFLQK